MFLGKKSWTGGAYIETGDVNESKFYCLNEIQLNLRSFNPIEYVETAIFGQQYFTWYRANK